MFKGTIKGNSRKILVNLLQERKAKNFYVGCSGAFTIENLLLRNLEPKKITSSDVSIFTNAIGFFLSGEDFDLDIIGEDFSYLKPYLEKGLAYKTAIVLFLQDLADHIPNRNWHQTRMIRNYTVEHKWIIEAKVNRLNETKQLMEQSGVDFSYHAEDVTDFVKRVEKGSIFTAFPPFWVGGYEKLYRFIDETLVSKKLRPEYKIFDDDSLKGMVNTLKESGAEFILGTNRLDLFKDDPDLSVVAFDYFSPGELVHFITNFKSESKFAKTNGDFISENYGVKLGNGEDFKNITLKSKIDIKEIPLDLFDAIRLSRLSEKVKEPAAPTSKFGVFVDDKLLGVFGIDVQNMKMQEDSFYLLADLPVENKYDSAKLISALATTKGVRDFLRGKYLVDYPTIRTTAFTNNPISMKYRNFWRVDSRNEKKHFVNYITEMGKYHKNDVIQKWLSLRKGKNE